MDRIQRSLIAATPAGRAYLEHLDAEKARKKRQRSARRSSRSPRAPGPDKAAKREETHAQRSSRVRLEVWNRATSFSGVVGVTLCECGCGYPISWETFHMDHWIGGSRRRAMTDATNCWALHPTCDRAKTENFPSVEHWNEKRRAFCARHGLPFGPRKPTVYYAQRREGETTP